jgi:hypothetical protein
MAKAKSKEPTVWGGIKNLLTGAEYEWDGVTIAKAVADCQLLKGTIHGRHWDFVGDLGLDEANIYVDHVSRNKSQYMGKQAISRFLADHAPSIKPLTKLSTKYFAPYAFANHEVEAETLPEAVAKSNDWLKQNGYMIPNREVKSRKWGKTQVSM